MNILRYMADGPLILTGPKKTILLDTPLDGPTVYKNVSASITCLQLQVCHEL